MYGYFTPSSEYDYDIVDWVIKPASQPTIKFSCIKEYSVEKELFFFFKESVLLKLSVNFTLGQLFYSNVSISFHCIRSRSRVCFVKKYIIILNAQTPN